MNDSNLLWGTYRRVADHASVFGALQRIGLAGIDTAPNYQGGEAERAIGKLSRGTVPVFGKVGYTGGDTTQLQALSGDRRFCLSPKYIKARAYLSAEALFPSGGKFACISLHNPEHLWENASEERARAELSSALAALGELWSNGTTAAIGVASWTIVPDAPRGQLILDCARKLGLQEAFRFFMHPANILRREFLRTSAPASNSADPQPIASAPLAGGQALELLGPQFSRYFSGISDPLAQCMMLAQYGSKRVCVGIGSMAHADALTKLNNLPPMSETQMTSLLSLLGADD